ncbi:hypothetical protein J2Z48_002927 [Croceifilum oryzae]|uniref:Uncharacterized protein n=1 Tax=Croceifilum oryzae TaxID=1553429 RepID=A0AAJ1WU57_9BACL|nr:hypothetical protein [Croceifilum oryzae]MDQ0418723.1 hypothetical protein [Croceifilum oryzae]
MRNIMSKIGQQLGQGISGVIDELAKAFYQRGEKAIQNEKDLIQLHNQALDALEKQLAKELEGHSLVPADPQVEVSPTVPKEKEPDKVVEVGAENTSLHSNGESTHTQAVAEMKDGLERDFHHQNLSFEREGEVFSFKKIQEGNIVFSNPEQTKDVVIEPKDLNVGLEMRGRLEALQYYRSLSPDDVLKTLKEVQKVAKREGRPVEEVYRERLQIKIERSVTLSRGSLLKQAEITSEDIKEIKMELREAENEINKNFAKLEKGRSNGEVNPEEYKQLKANLEGRKGIVKDRLMQIEGAEKKLEAQVKTDLKAQYPSMDMKKLSLAEAVSIGLAAETVTEKGIDKLRDFASNNKMDDLLQALEKSTKEVEIVVEETIDREVFSR